MASSDASSLSFAISGGSSPTEPILSLMDAQVASPEKAPAAQSSGSVPPSVPKIKDFPPSLPGPVVRRLDTPTSGSSASKRGKSADASAVARSTSPLVLLDTPKRRSSSARSASSGDSKSGRRKRKIKRHDSRKKFPPSRGSSIRHPLTAPSQSLELHMTLSRSDRLS